MMSYSDIELYNSLYGEISEAEYNRLAWLAARLLDIHTSGVDGVRKLQVAFPVNLDAAESVSRCECALIDLLRRVENTRKLGEPSTNGEGLAVSGPVSAVSSGAESISYAVGGSVINDAAADNSIRGRLVADIVREYLGGVADANGVNLLYMGVYPCTPTR